MSQELDQKKAQRAAELREIEADLDRRAEVGKRIKATGDEEAYEKWVNDELNQRAREALVQRKLGNDAYMEWWWIQQKTYVHDPEGGSWTRDYSIPENFERACLFDYEFSLYK
jgi:hypothetical protein